LKIYSWQWENSARFSSKSAKMATLLWRWLRNWTRISGHRQRSIENLRLLLSHDTERDFL